MISNLLKQLFLALGQFVGYHVRRILRLPEKPRTARSPPVVAESSTVTTANETSIANLSDAVGLNPEYQRRVQWPCYRTDMPSQEVASNALYKMWTTFPGGHKWTHYFPI